MIDPNTYVYDFGKYGKIQAPYKNTVMTIDGVRYAIWAHENVDKFELPQEEYDRLKKALSDYLRKKSNYRKGMGWK